MYVKDFSPYHENKSGLPDCVAIRAGYSLQYYNAISYFTRYFGAKWINNRACSIEEAKNLLPKNSKVYVVCAYNDIIGRYEIGITNRKGTKNLSYYKFDFVGGLNEFALKYPVSTAKNPA